MKLDKISLFEETRMLWPEEVRTKKTSPSGHPDFGELFNDIYWPLEGRFDVNDHWHQLSIWAYHQALSKYKEEAITIKLFSVQTRCVNFEEWDLCMLSNLSNECWVKELALYLER